MQALAVSVNDMHGWWQHTTCTEGDSTRHCCLVELASTKQANTDSIRSKAVEFVAVFMSSAVAWLHYAPPCSQLDGSTDPPGVGLLISGSSV